MHFKEREMILAVQTPLVQHQRFQKVIPSKFVDLHTFNFKFRKDGPNLF